MWSKGGRFVEGLHVVSDILTKISVNCVLIYMMHYYLCVYFCGFSLCVVDTCLYIYGYFLSMLHVYVYYYFSMNLCIYRMYLSILIFIYIIPQEFMCVYVLICLQFEKFYVAFPVGCWGSYNMYQSMKYVWWYDVA